jgi:hypothetical protein
MAGAFSMMGAVPLQQGGVPPQPFHADLFSGKVILQSAPAPPGIQLVACIDGCQVFESQPVALNQGGEYTMLAANPENRRLRGRDVTFYLVNEYGRIKAAETAVFEGGFNLTRLDLHFNEPLPVAPPPPALPQVGDPLLPYLPPVALAVGATAVIVGIFLYVRGRRQRAY